MSVFKNLARGEYRKAEDLAVCDELRAAGIPILTLPSYLNAEVKTHYVGLLNGFLFTRAWRYWVCTGDIPIKAASQIYELFYHLSVRAGGDCRNGEPVGYNPAYLQALQVKMNELRDRGITDYQAMAAELNTIKEAEDAPRFVQVYHIDTAEGLCALVQFLLDNEIYAHNGEAHSYAASAFRTEEEEKLCWQ